MAVDLLPGQRGARVSCDILLPLAGVNAQSFSPWEPAEAPPPGTAARAPSTQTSRRGPGDAPSSRDRRLARLDQTRGMPPEAVEHPLEKRQRLEHVPRADQPVPERLELLPARGVGEVTRAADPLALARSAAPDRAPAIEVAIGRPVAGLELFGAHASRAVDDVARVVAVPLAVQDAPLALHASVERGSGA